MCVCVFCFQNYLILHHQQYVLRIILDQTVPNATRNVSPVIRLQENVPNVIVPCMESIVSTIVRRIASICYVTPQQECAMAAKLDSKETTVNKE